MNGLNQSEAGAGLFTLFAVTAALIANYGRFLRKPWLGRAALLALLGISFALLAWFLFPIPQGFGRIFFFFDRVRPDRLLLTFAVASALALCLFLEAQRRGSDGPSGPRVAGTVAFVLPTLWAGLTLEIDGEAPSRWQVLVLVAVFAVGIALALRGMRTGLWLLVAVFAVGAATINPLQRGLAPLVDGPSAQLGRTLRARPDAGVVLTFAEGGGLDARAGLIASGVRLVSGVNLYPNKAAWRVLDADGSERHAWDRYNNAVWNAGPPGSEPQITGEGDRVDVVVDPCDAVSGNSAYGPSSARCR